MILVQQTPSKSVVSSNKYGLSAPSFIVVDSLFAQLDAGHSLPEHRHRSPHSTTRQTIAIVLATLKDSEPQVELQVTDSFRLVQTHTDSFQTHSRVTQAQTRTSPPRLQGLVGPSSKFPTSSSSTHIPTSLLHRSATTSPVPHRHYLRLAASRESFPVILEPT